MHSEKQQVIIVGNGIAGITAALAFRKHNSEAAITVVSDETELFYSRTALMYVYMRQMKFSDTVVHPAVFFKKQAIDLLFSSVTKIDYKAKRLTTASGVSLSYDYLLLAPGSRPRMPGITGDDLPGVQGLYSKGDLDQLEKISAKGISRAAIIGGGLIGVELAEMLVTRKIPLVFLVRDSLYFGAVLPKAEAEMVTAEIQSHGVDLRLSAEVAAIAGDANGVTGITTKSGEHLPCSLVGMTIGVTPRIELTTGSRIKTDRGIITDEFLRTNDPCVFAAGDAAEVKLLGGAQRVQQLWYTGRMQGEVAGYNLAQALAEKPLKEYDPGHFFNSAKFFSLEYQTYGPVPATASGKDSILWQDTAKKKLIRISFAKKAGERIVQGFNLLGIRYRHKICEAWIDEGATAERVLNELHLANFDPEFYQRFEENLRSMSA